MKASRGFSTQMNVFSSISFESNSSSAEQITTLAFVATNIDMAFSPFLLQKVNESAVDLKIADGYLTDRAFDPLISNGIEIASTNSFTVYFLFIVNTLGFSFLHLQQCAFFYKCFLHNKKVNIIFRGRFFKF